MRHRLASGSKVLVALAVLTVVLIGGLKGADAASREIERTLHSFERMPRTRRAFRLYGIPVANPESLRRDN